jgi:hypothetical protein
VITMEAKMRIHTRAGAALVLNHYPSAGLA